MGMVDGSHGCYSLDTSNSGIEVKEDCQKIVSTTPPFANAQEGTCVSKLVDQGLTVGKQ